MATPGLQNWPIADGNGTSQIQQQFDQQGGPMNWQRQTDAFISAGMGGGGGAGGSGGRKRIMQNGGDPNTMDRETWRMQQQQKVNKIININ